MIVHNVTTRIDPQIEKEWIGWEKEYHMPLVLATGLFNDCRMFRLLDQDEASGITFVVQYFTSSLEDYKKYMDEFASALNEKVFSKWGEQIITFSTVMEIVH